MPEYPPIQQVDNTRSTPTAGEEDVALCVATIKRISGPVWVKGTTEQSYMARIIPLSGCRLT
ncbi:hypothetical protein [Ktedonobacter robiniae]|uniref:hypothetical protein n=1 Tax=Ktedonobacter robiniae TaxID=2778365 RepID=UPI001F164514|nr:hypothetical protein [Ktedonobacter robiniae]